VALACLAALAGPPVALAQVTPAAPASAGAPAYSAAELEKLVGPIALYPDDLVAIILPASTYPLQLVQASRFFDKRKANPQLQPDSTWDDSVKSLLNYPDIVKKMNDDLDWTEALGEAVVTNSSAVLDAVQAFRRRAEGAGNLKSDAKQVVVVEKEVIRIVPANPEVIYVPQYQPSTVVVAGSPVAYYPTPYPVYYYPYPPGAALAAGIIWGAALGAAWNGGRWGADYYGGGGGNSISVNNSTNINTGNRPGTGAGSGNRPGAGGGAGSGNRPGAGGGSAWKPSQQPGQVGRPSTQPAGGGRAGSGYAQPGGAGGYGAAGGARPSTQPAGAGSMGGQRDFSGGGAGRGDGGAFGGMGSGGAAQQSSMRGQSSRQAGGFGGGAQGGRQAGGFQQGGGARAGGGSPGGGARGGGASAGGGARSGGGARGGGRR